MDQLRGQEISKYTKFVDGPKWVGAFWQEKISPSTAPADLTLAAISSFIISFEKYSSSSLLAMRPIHRLHHTEHRDFHPGPGQEQEACR